MQTQSRNRKIAQQKEPGGVSPWMERPMNTTPSLEDAVKAIAAEYRKERIRGTIKAVVLWGLGGIISFLAASFVAYVMITVPDMPVSTMPVYFFAVLGMIAFAMLFFVLKDLKTNEKRQVHYLENYPTPPFNANEFFEHGFYELALMGYDKWLKDLFEESQKREDELNRFFEEYRTKTRFVGDFPRPIPAFPNHNLHDFDHCIAGRVKCLAKLGREKEAEAAIAQRETIGIIQGEGVELTEKYWKQKHAD